MRFKQWAGRHSLATSFAGVALLQGLAARCFAADNQRVTQCGTMMVYAVGEELKKNKNAIVQACHDLACTDEQLRLALAVAMGETNTCCAALRDASKDCTPSANYSCFNLNKDMLEQVGWHEGGPDLNKDENIRDAISYIITATHQYGIDGFLHFHRGGRTALLDHTSYGAQDYAAKIKCVMEMLRLQPEHQTDGNRIGFSIPHV